MSLQGYMGTILRVDLSRNKIWKQPLPEEWKEKYIGGHGIGAKILYDEVPPWVDDFDPENRLIFATGPVTGSVAQTAGRHTMVFKSPLTGYFGDSSCGGFWGTELKFAGYDVLVVQGRAEKPKIISIKDEDVEILDASSYWGMNARESDRAITTDLGDKRIQVSNIGIGGENMVRFAALMHDDAGRAAGRGGAGAVMGHKRLKAVAVRGSKRVPVADGQKLSKLMREVMLWYKENPLSVDGHKMGTVMGFESCYAIGDTPSYNWADPDFGEDFNPDNLSTPGGFDQILKGTNTCYSCTLACRRVSNGQPPTGKEQYAIEDGVEGVEYENEAMLGSNCGIDDIWAVNKLNDLCNLHGLDAISAGAAISFAMECFERGAINATDLDGLELRFGDADAAITMLEKIARRDGFGDVLAEGTRRAARIIGGEAPKYSIDVKGMEIAAHDPRAFQGGAPHYATAITGGRHTEGLTLELEQGGKAVELGLTGDYDLYSTSGKGAMARFVQDWYCVHSTFGWCQFAYDFKGYHEKPSEFMETYKYITGKSMTVQEAMKIGERVFTLRKAFNMRHGCTREEDTLPERLLKKQNRRANNMVAKLNETLPEYYTSRNWDSATSKPKPEKLQELGLGELVKDLWA